jgi:succinate dehydrogenase / fumarate reductase membrane anchor subunit
MINRIVVGAHYGLKDWLLQRLTAVVMALYLVFMVFYVAGYQPVGFAGWKAMFAQQWLRLFSAVFFLSLFYHAWVGVRDITMDYIKPASIRLTVQFLVVVALVAYAVWAVQILWS